MALVWKHSDDPGPGVYTVGRHATRRYVAGFVKMARRLRPGAIDTTVSRLGYHVIKRMPDDFTAPARPLPALIEGPCPLAREDPATCPEAPAQPADRVVVEHILIGYKGSRAGRRRQRNREDAHKLAIDVVHRARRKGADWQALRKQVSDDPGDGRYEVGADTTLERAFEQRARSLSPGNVDAVWTPFGYHVMRRIK